MISTRMHDEYCNTIISGEALKPFTWMNLFPNKGQKFMEGHYLLDYSFYLNYRFLFEWPNYEFILQVLYHFPYTLSGLGRIGPYSIDLVYKSGFGEVNLSFFRDETLSVIGYGVVREGVFDSIFIEREKGYEKQFSRIQDFFGELDVQKCSVLFSELLASQKRFTELFVKSKNQVLTEASPSTY